MGAQAESMLAGSIEDQSSFGDGEGAAFAEHVNESCQLAVTRWQLRTFRSSIRRWFLCHPGDHFFANQTYVGFTLGGKFAGHDVRAEQSWNDCSGKFCGGIANGFERFDLAGHIEAVTGLGFNRGRAVLVHALEGGVDMPR